MGIFNFLKRHKSSSATPIKEYNNAFIFVEPVAPISPDIITNRDANSGQRYIPKRKSELSGVTQSIWTFAPDEYDTQYWPTPNRPTLESDFEELRRGIEVVFRQKRFNERRPQLLSLVEEAYSAYKLGDRKTGISLITQIQIMSGKMK